ncbi:hypothetical protein ADK57_32460 [Streptomyces sp. MMG1533]|uniref:hypothetical protein n=1 Tax=Streptomyces sp. MMG1533 TaxID=1415546 RepID=UPI0006AF0A9F|nr:hypothetical protein [Streptomyces sp. MMG1533]KOU59830.1 hypothetical protein ADK57_32460 [Streptomyces sp. MMG1533]
MTPAPPGVVAGTVAAPGPVAQGVGPAAVSASVEHHAEAGKAAARTVTLITGDRVAPRPRPGGAAPAASVLPGEGRQGMDVRIVRTARAGTPHISLIPADAERLPAAGTLDARLFDITELIRIGRDDTRSPSLPLIVMERRGKAPARSAFTAHGSDLGPTLRAPNGGTLTQPKDSTVGRWQSLFKGRLAHCVSKLWLDGKAKAPDDESNKTVGAPTSWKSGLAECLLPLLLAPVQVVQAVGWSGV